MKATIDINGRLTVRAESEIEAYALKRWWDDYRDGSPEFAVDILSWDCRTLESTGLGE